MTPTIRCPLAAARRALLLTFLSLGCSLVAAVPAHAQAKDPAAFQAQIWASSCMSCHGPDGRAEVTGLTIGGRAAQDLLGKLLAFKTGKLTATIMHQQTKGYSDEELGRIAQYFSTLK